jgi:hypothetical protein
MTTYLPLDSNLQCGKCYTMQFVVNDFTTNFTITFGRYIPDFDQWIENGTVGTVSSNGTKSLTFDSEDCVQIGVQSNYIKIEGGTATLTNLSLRLDEECVGSLCSECYTVIKDCEKIHTIEYWNDEDSFNLRYTNTNFKQTLLIPGRLTPIDYPYPIEEIHKYGNGRKAPIKTDSEEVYEFVTEQLPDYLIDALRIALKHKHLLIDGESYCKVEGNITPEFDPEISLASQVVFQVQKNNQDFYADIC